MKEKIRQLREKAQAARSLAKLGYQWNTCTSTSYMRNAIDATADGFDLMADMFEQLYSEEESEER